MGFETAFDEADCLPCPAIVLGENVEILCVSAANGRQELIATCHHAGRRHQIALLDTHVNADQPASHPLAAYRHWTGAENTET
jgi:hypothetical protein